MKDNEISIASPALPTKRPARKKVTKTGRADNADDTASIAAELKRFITENKLVQDIHGKEYVNVEAWQYAASRLGYVVLVDDSRLLNMSTEGELKYSAFASLYHIATGHSAGGGFGLCSNKENGKRSYNEFAICSMAQTRAVSKAVRTTFAYLIKAAGFEATPAEEMDFTAAPAASEKPQAALGTPPAMKALPAGNASAAPTAAQRPATTSPARSTGAAASTEPMGEQVAEKMRVFAAEVRKIGERATLQQADKDKANETADKIDAVAVAVRTGKTQGGADMATIDRLLELVNSAEITRKEKVNVLVSIYQLSEPKALATIKKLEGAIAYRKANPKAA